MLFTHMLDTNTLSEIISSKRQGVRDRFRSHDRRSLCISAVSRGEIEYGLAFKPEAVRRAMIAAGIFARIAVLPWSSETALVYGRLRSEMRRAGKGMGPLDMLIAAHALEASVALVTSDRAFRNVAGLEIEDWLAGEPSRRP